MIYLLAVALLFAVVFVAWRLVSIQNGGNGGGGPVARGPRKPVPRGPDDDPDFMRTIDRR